MPVSGSPGAARALRQSPGGRLGYIGVERAGTAGARIIVEVAAPGRLPRGEDFYFDSTGRQIGRGRSSSTGSVGMQAYSAAAQLHFGFFGGLPVRLVYVALGRRPGPSSRRPASPSGSPRRRDRGKPSVRLRRAWMAWTWGVPAGLALAALASPYPPAGAGVLGLDRPGPSLAPQWTRRP